MWSHNKKESCRTHGNGAIIVVKKTFIWVYGVIVNSAAHLLLGIIIIIGRRNSQCAIPVTHVWVDIFH